MQKISLKRGDFNFPIKLAGDGTEHISSENVLCDVPWKIKICERQDGNEMVLDATLICSSPKELTVDHQWTCEAMAKVSVCSFAVTRQFNEKTIPKTKFEDKCLSSEPVEIIRVVDLSQYTRDDRVVFDVQLLANPIFYQSSAEMDHMLAKFKFPIENVSRLERKYSPDVKVHGAIWNISARKHENHLGIFLRHKDSKINVNWSWKVKCSFTLLSFDKNIQPATDHIAKDFSSDVPSWGLPEFLAWNTLMDPAKRYVENDKTVFVINLEVDSPEPLWNFDQQPVTTKSLECSICLQDSIGRAQAVTKCGHVFCNTCIKLSVEQHRKCPNCNAEAKLEDIRPIFI